jgi:aminoacrylate hydrolase
MAVTAGKCEGIFYEESGSGFPVMLIPGLGGVGSYWQPQISELSKTYRVVTHDHRGTGQSAKSRISYSVLQMAEDALAVMDELGIDKAHLVGHSTGGAIAQVLLTEQPHRFERAILYATWARPDAFFKRCFEVRRHLLRTGGLDAYARGAPLFLYPSWWVRDKESSTSFASDPVYGEVSTLDIVDSRIQAVLDFDWLPRLCEISAPCLVLGVENDHLTPAYLSREIAAHIPGASLAIMADGAHAASFVMPEEFNRLVLKYLRLTKDELRAVRGASVQC